jgi:hypothetical protein
MSGRCHTVTGCLGDTAATHVRVGEPFYAAILLWS